MFLAVIDGTGATAVRQARALGAFLQAGVRGDLTGSTLVLYHDDDDRDRLVSLAPTCDVRLVKVPSGRSEPILEVLSAAARETEAALVLFAEGTKSTELAARLALRRDGVAFTGALDVEATAQGLICRKSVYSGHLVGRFELRRRPWCVCVDASWNDAGEAGPAEHLIVSDTDASADAGDSPFADVDVVATPPSSDLAHNRFLIVAGSGAGGREGVERIAQAARRMGAAFGVTRPVAMSALAGMDRLVGVSGARAAPRLCIVAGASGAPAFYWGVEKATFIVAINTDEAAPIVDNADVAVIDDGVAVIEELAKIVAAEGGVE
jgi:electron transfer flavoprotein alpha subunit